MGWKISFGSGLFPLGLRDVLWVSEVPIEIKRFLLGLTNFIWISLGSEWFGLTDFFWNVSISFRSMKFLLCLSDLWFMWLNMSTNVYSLSILIFNAFTVTHEKYISLNLYFTFIGIMCSKYNCYQSKPVKVIYTTNYLLNTDHWYKWYLSHCISS